MTKRARNEGSIYRQQTDGRWVAAISVGYRNGHRRRKKFFGATRGAVAAQLTQALHDHQHGLPVAPDRQTVGNRFSRGGWRTRLSRLSGPRRIAATSSWSIST